MDWHDRPLETAEADAPEAEYQLLTPPEPTTLGEVIDLIEVAQDLATVADQAEQEGVAGARRWVHGDVHELLFQAREALRTGTWRRGLLAGDPGERVRRLAALVPASREAERSEVTMLDHALADAAAALHGEAA